MPRSSLALFLLLAACHSGDARTTTWNGETISAGDTTVIRTHSGTVHGRHVLDSVRVLWQSDALERPTQLVLVGSDRLAIADRTRIHLIATDGTPIASLGREGEGPGEFLQLGAIGSSSTGQVFGVDRRNRHWARFGSDGALQATGMLEPHPELPSLQPGRVAVAGDTVTLGWGSLIRSDGSPGFAAAVSHRAGAPAEERARVIGQPYVFGPSGTASSASLFGPTPRVALSADGRIALSDGVEYCIWVLDTRTRRFCRDWERVAVTDAVRHPDWDAIAAESEMDPAQLGPVREVLDLVQVGDRRYALAAIAFDSDSRLWVQAVDSTTANVHPILIRFTPDRRPSHRQWDIFDPDGRLLWELVLPTRFTPADSRGHTVYGLHELDSGELVVASIEIPGRP